jgi:hypothetical protein
MAYRVKLFRAEAGSAAISGKTRLQIVIEHIGDFVFQILRMPYIR